LPGTHANAAKVKSSIGNGGIQMPDTFKHA